MKLRLSRSLIRSNKFVTIAMFMMYVIIMALLVMLNFFSDSFDESLDSYMNEYGYPQIVICPHDGELIDEATVEEVKATDGVINVSARMSNDYFTDFENKADPDSLYYEERRYLSLRYNTADENLNFYDVNQKIKIKISEESVMVPSVFARGNGLEVGDVLEVNTDTGIHKLEISNIISCPETISVKRSSIDNYDDNDFTYIYISEKIGEQLNGISGSYNRLLVMGDEDKVIDNLRLRDSSKYRRMSIIGYSGSDIDKQLHNSTDASRAAIRYMVIFIVLIGTIFTTLFINQIVRKSKGFIGLLRALGVDKNGVVTIFLMYVLSLIIVSAVAGVMAGYGMLKFMLRIYQDYFVMPDMVISGNPIEMVVLLLGECLIGVISCILSAKAIAGVDPVEVFNGGVDGSREAANLPEFIDRHIKDGFTKISLCGLIRNKRRIIITILCNIACITLTCAGVEILAAKQAAFEYTINTRMQYDLIVGTSDEDQIEKIQNTNGVVDAIPIVRIGVDNYDENITLNALDSDSVYLDIRTPEGEKISIPDYGIVVEEGFAERNGYEVGDTIKINYEPIEIKAICREYLFPVAYVSQQQMNALGYSGHNACYVYLSRDSRYYSFAHEFDDADYMIYTAFSGRLALKTMAKLDAPCWMFIFLAMLLGFIIVNNMNRLSLMERAQEFTTLRLLGTRQSKFAKMLSIEAIAEYIPAVILGTPIGLISTKALEDGMSSLSMHYVMTEPLRVSVISALLVLIYIILGIIINMHNIKKLI